MIFGVLLLMAIFSIFVVTHFLKYSSDQAPLQLAAELSMIALSGMFLIAFVIALRHVV